MANVRNTCLNSTGPFNPKATTHIDPTLVRSPSDYANYADSASVSTISGIHRRAVQDDELLIFSDGFQVTGKELGTLLKIAKKLGVKEYPEDFL